MSKPPSTRNRKALVKSLDGWFSRYIRLTHSKGDYCRCITCGTRVHWKECDAGHFQTRNKYSTRWHEDNVRPQCKSCNYYHQGRPYLFGLALDKEKEGLAHEMILLGNQIRKFSNVELCELEDEYRRKVKQLLK